MNQLCWTILFASALIGSAIVFSGSGEPNWRAMFVVFVWLALSVARLVLTSE